MVDHISREVHYFRKRLIELNEGKLKALAEAIIKESVSFLRIMADHVFREAEHFLEIIDLFEEHPTGKKHNHDNIYWASFYIRFSTL